MKPPLLLLAALCAAGCSEKYPPAPAVESMTIQTVWIERGGIVLMIRNGNGKIWFAREEPSFTSDTYFSRINTINGISILRHSEEKLTNRLEKP